jgi:hypothetical protein
MSPIFGGKQDRVGVDTSQSPRGDEWGWRFTLKGSPRHYDDVVKIVESGGDARVYFGEALTYERGAGVALWRIKATGFSWLPKLYAWWAEQERIEPVRFTIHLYIPPDTKYPALDLREHPAAEVERLIRERAPRD